MRILWCLRAWFIGLVSIFVIGFVGKLIFFPVHTGQQVVETAYDSVTKTINAENAIMNYEWFKKQQEDIKALEEKAILANQSVEDFKVDAWDRSNRDYIDKEEYSRLKSIADGLIFQYKDAVALYNARSKMANRNIFADWILPSYMEALTFVTKN